MSVGLGEWCVCVCVFDRAVQKCLGENLTILPRLKRTKLRHLRYTQHPEVFKCSLTHMYGGWGVCV